MSDGEQSDISINKQLEVNNLANYKQYVKNTVREIADNLKKIELQSPQSKHDI